MPARLRLSRRQFMASSALGAASLAFLGSGLPASAARPSYVYVGCYTMNPPGGGSPTAEPVGISVYAADPAGALTLLEEVPTENPSFLAFGPHGRFLYAVNELNDYGGAESGAISSYAIDRASGTLTFLNQQATHGAWPAHLTMDPSEHFVIVANYGPGLWTVFPIQPDGSLGAAVAHFQNTGSGPNPDRQEGPHAHSINFDPRGRFALGCDLGTDEVLVWQLTSAGELDLQHRTSVAPGAGPRHLAFHPTGHHVYVINELHSTITVFAYDQWTGELTELQTISTLPAGFSGTNSTAEIVVHPNGRFVYGSNRGHNSIAIFAVDRPTGRLSALGHVSTQGEIPRNFNIDPTGNYLYAANQKTDTIVQFRISRATGGLTPTGNVTDSPTPVCVIFGHTAAPGRHR